MYNLGDAGVVSKEVHKRFTGRVKYIIDISKNWQQQIYLSLNFPRIFAYMRSLTSVTLWGRPESSLMNYLRFMLLPQWNCDSALLLLLIAQKNQYCYRIVGLFGICTAKLSFFSFSKIQKRKFNAWSWISPLRKKLPTQNKPTLYMVHEVSHLDEVACYNEYNINVECSTWCNHTQKHPN